MNALPPHDADAFAEALRAERPSVDQLIDLAACFGSAAMLFAGRCLELQHKVDAMGGSQRLRGAEIIAQVCRDHGIKVARLMSSARCTEVAAVRRAACVKLNAAGFSQAEIARLLKVESTCVRYALKRAAGLSRLEIKNQATGRKAANSWKPEEREVAARFAAGAITKAEALQHLPGRTESALLTYLRRNNIKRARP